MIVWASKCIIGIAFEVMLLFLIIYQFHRHSLYGSVLMACYVSCQDNES